MSTQTEIPFAAYDKEKGYVCPCCNQYVKMYRRSFNCNMALAVLALYKYRINGFVKVEDFLLKHGYQRCGDFSYLVHYGLLEKLKAKREDGSKKNGYYKLTGRGIMFVEGNLKVFSKFLIFNNELQGFSGEEISIRQALGKRFNYDDLMKFPQPEPSY